MGLQSFAKRWPRATALAVGLALGVVSLILAELWARRVHPLREGRDIFECRQLRPELGGGFRANCSSRWIRRSGKQTVFDIQFDTDAFGRRHTPQQDLATRPRLALFMGCSFTLGAGAESAETLPYDFGELARQYRVLNYGGSGFGPEQTLAYLETGLSEHEIGPYEGEPLMIHTLAPGQVGSAAGSRSILGTYGRYFPSYALAPDGRLVFEGSFAEAHPLRTAWSRLVMQSALLQGIPERLDGGDVELTARQILEASRRFRERFASGRFVVVAYPGYWPRGSRLLKQLRGRGLTLLESDDVCPPDEPGLRLADGHPNARAHQRVAAWLHRELEQRHLLEAQAEYQSTAKK